MTHLSSSGSLPLSSEKPVPDRRHLEKIHKRVGGDDGLGQSVIDPYHTPLLPMPASRYDRKPAVQLRMVVSEAAKPKFSSKKGTTAHCLSSSDGWATVLSNKKAKAPSVKPAWGLTISGQSVAPTPRPVNPCGTGATEIPDLRKMRRDSDIANAAAVQPPAETDITKFPGPERALPFVRSHVLKAVTEHPVVSQKKLKKHEREAKRKAKKQDAASPPVKLIEPTEEGTEPVVTTAVTIHDPGVHNFEAYDMRHGPSPITSVNTSVASERIEELSHSVANAQPRPNLENMSTPALQKFHITSSSRHLHWLRFERELVVDRPTDVCLEGLVGQHCGEGYGTSCAFEANNIKDCPFHEPCEFLS